MESECYLDTDLWKTFVTELGMAAIVENQTDGCSKKERSRLAKERREDKDKSQAAREQTLWEKQRRAQEQYLRSVEDRSRRLEEQRQKEMIRRSAVEEKRRQRVEEEKERLEALMRRSMERNLQADQRPKRWTWCGPPGVCEVEDFMIQPESPDSLSRNFSSATLTERASSSPHRSPYRASPNRGERKKNEKPEKCTIQSFVDYPMKKLESPTTPTRSSSASKNPGTPKRSRSSKSRIQSPASPGQYPPSPMKHRATTPCKETKTLEGEEKGSLETKGTSTLERKTSRTERIPKSTSKELGYNAESPVTPTGKAGTTDAEEASRLLAERRRLAREQREQEEKHRLEEERLRAEELQRQQEEEIRRQERAAREAEEKRQRQEIERCQREQDERQQKEQRWKDLQDDLERQREEAVQRVHREAERKRQERELLKIQEDEERLQRKKRIDEIMKRTRKQDGESKKEEPSADTPHISVSPSPSPLETGGGPPKATSESPVICLEPLEAKGNGADDLSDGVQSMDVSPVSRDELLSVAEYSPVSEMALGDILVLAGQVSHPKGSAAPSFGDCNKNLIQDCSSAAIDSSLFQSLIPTSDKLNI